MTETPEQTDERRARAIEPVLLLVGAGKLAKLLPDLVPLLVRQLRASDEEAGMVLVPREATEAMVIAALDAWYVPPMVPWREQPGDTPFRFMADMKRTIEAALAACEKGNR